ncbi:MAG: helix-turn-helix domain-containing protein [Enterococcus sp.]|nr:helix-turn-helix domain-containing protein [Enterococcus sp.]
MKSMKQIADMTGVSKMTVYRYIKANNITETSQKKQNFVI